MRGTSDNCVVTSETELEDDDDDRVVIPLDDDGNNNPDDSPKEDDVDETSCFNFLFEEVKLDSFFNGLFDDEDDSDNCVVTSETELEDDDDDRLVIPLDEDGNNNPDDSPIIFKLIDIFRLLWDTDYFESIFKHEIYSVIYQIHVMFGRGKSLKFLHIFDENSKP